MTDGNECFDTSDMDRDEVEQLLDNLHEAYHEEIQRANGLESNAGILISSMFEVSRLLDAGNTLGNRKKLIEEAVVKLQVTATMAYMAMPGALQSQEETMVNSEFERLTAMIEAEDPNFGNPTE